MLLRFSSCLVFFVLFARFASASMTVDVTSPTTVWTPVTYGSNHPDPFQDQQTGSTESDIAGDASHPSAYVAFGDAGTPSLTDGTLGFRLRLGADQNPAGFKTAAFFGIDANSDGILDLFIGVCNSGAGDLIGIWDPGAGLNISPNTTSIVSPALFSYTQTATNYSWTPVNSTIDPTVGGATDLNGDGKNDYFLTFSVSFADVVTVLAGKGIIVDQNSTISYVIATATQDNSLNQDLNGVGGSYDPNATWSTLGVISDPITLGATPVPEFNPAFAAALLALAATAERWWNRRRRAAKSL